MADLEVVVVVQHLTDEAEDAAPVAGEAVHNRVQGQGGSVFRTLSERSGRWRQCHLVQPDERAHSGHGRQRSDGHRLAGDSNRRLKGS